MSDHKISISTVFFDLGNVLVFVYIERFFKAFSGLTGLPLAETMSLADSHEKTIDMFNRGLMGAEEFYETVTAGLNSVDFGSFKSAYTEIFDLNSFMLDFARQVKQSSRISIISNTDTLHYEYIGKQFDFLKLFESPITSFEAHAMKPEKKIYLTALETMHENPENTLFIDDKIENIEAAQSLGMHGIHYTENTSFMHQLDAYTF